MALGHNHAEKIYTKIYTKIYQTILYIYIYLDIFGYILVYFGIFSAWLYFGIFWLYFGIFWYILVYLAIFWYFWYLCLSGPYRSTYYYLSFLLERVVRDCNLGWPEVEVALGGAREEETILHRKNDKKKPKMQTST